MARSSPTVLVSESKIFSATTLQTYQNCPLQYKFGYIDKIPVLPTPPMVFGSTIHSVIEKLTTHPDITLESRYHARSLLDEFWPSEVYESEYEESQARISAHAILDTYLAWQATNKNTVTGVEHEFTFLFADHTLNGFIDRIEQTPDGGYVVIDFKSGKKPSTISKNKNQAKYPGQYVLSCGSANDRVTPRKGRTLFLKRWQACSLCAK